MRFITVQTMSCWEQLIRDEVFYADKSKVRCVNNDYDELSDKLDAQPIFCLLFTKESLPQQLEVNRCSMSVNPEYLLGKVWICFDSYAFVRNENRAYTDHEYAVDCIELDKVQWAYEMYPSGHWAYYVLKSLIGEDKGKYKNLREVDFGKLYSVFYNPKNLTTGMTVKCANCDGLTNMYNFNVPICSEVCYNEVMQYVKDYDLNIETIDRKIIYECRAGRYKK